MKSIPERGRVGPRIAIVVAAGLVFLASAAFSSAAVVERPGPKEARKLSFARSSVPGARSLRAFACSPATIGCNTTVSGTLTSDDCLYGDGTNYDIWTFQGNAGDSVTITMTTAGFEPFVFLIDPAGHDSLFPAEEEGATQLQFTRTLNATGTWTIWANSFDPIPPLMSGAYSLDLRGCTSGPPPPPPACTADATTHCLNDGRFRVSVIFSAPNLGITNAPGRAVSVTSDTGYFWFFSANNIELMIKVVDGRGFNGYFWVFYGALSDVEYTITVTDTATDAVKTYRNTAGHLASFADVAAFPGGAAATASAPPDAATEISMTDLVRSQSETVSRFVAGSASDVCLSDATTLCLNNGRFRVRVIFSAPTLGISNAPAQAGPLTSDTGYFWFFSPNNVELVIKAVDGRGFNGYFWVFYGALSDVEYTITVTDMVTNAVKTYRNSPGNLASFADVAAFQ